MWNNCERIYPCCTLVFLFETRNDIKERERVREREKEGSGGRERKRKREMYLGFWDSWHSKESV